MKKTLKQLTLLQEIDAKVHALKIRRDEIPRQIEEQVRAVARARDRLNDVENRARELKKSLDGKNLELKDCEQKIYQKEVQLNTITTNDAYKAMLREIAGLKADKSRVEDGILEISYSQDDVAGEIESCKKEVAAAEKEHELRQAELGEQAGKLDVEIEALIGQREARAREIDPETLSQYERVLTRRHGQALAPVRDQHCQGCQMKLTLQEMTVVMACKELLTCRTCSRLLYLEQVVDGVEL
jgi:predicted  nucleic acid-binding Zn-ribbon protein